MMAPSRRQSLFGTKAIAIVLATVAGGVRSPAIGTEKQNQIRGVIQTDLRR